MFPGVTVPQAEAGKAAAAGGLFSAASGLLGPVGAGLSIAGGLSSMFDGGGMDVSRAVSGGTFMTGEMESGKSATLIVVGLILLVLLILFRGKK